MKFMRYLPPLGLAAIIGLFGIFGPNAAYSTTVSSCSASLDGSQEVPFVDTTGNGMATVEFDPSSNEITWSIEFTNLSGPATAAHFHGPAAEGTNAGVQVNIGDESGLDSPMEGSAELTAEQVTMLMDGEMYINIHTDDNPNGEIRGQVSCEAAPDDGTGDGSTQSVTVSVDDEEFDIDYAIINGTIDEATADPETQTLLLEMSTTSNGNLTIWLPTELIDSEDEYAVLIDGEFVNHKVAEFTID